MTFKNKIILLVLTFVVFLLLACTLRVVLRPAEIVAIHHRSSGFSDILVKNFPYTDQGKIAWWLENKGHRKNTTFPARIKTVLSI